MKCAESLRAQAYFDGEVDAVSAAEIERHAEHCGECRTLLQDLDRMRTAMRSLPRTLAPPALRARIRRALDREGKLETPRFNGWGRSTWRTRPFWFGALGGIGSTAMAAILAFSLLSPIGNPMLDEIVSAHLRSLMPAHLVDVVSTDQHTVKPWFAGHTDVSPLVADFAQAGYRLVGGRADYLDHQRSAVVVYQHGQHVINIFSWAGDRHALPKDTTRNGYRMAFWKAGDLRYCAVSDTGWDELRGLVRLLQDLSAHDTGTVN